MEDSSAKTLAHRIGVTPNTIHLAVHRGSCTDDLAKRIEKLFGREYFPRELFVSEPDLPVE
jgi:plasmid maintenance system antidote protein VapI